MGTTNNAISYYAEFHRIAKSIYGDNVYKRARDKSSGYVYIIFPKIIITNSRKETHTLRDFVVRFCISANSLDIRGTRLTCTYSEYRSGYMHSHISTGFIRGANCFRPFCLGSSPMRVMLLEYARSTSLEYKVSLMERVLLLLPRFIGWESIEGGPYYHISHIGKGAGNSVAITKEHIVTLMEYFNSHLDNATLRSAISILHTEYMLEVTVDTDRLEELMWMAITSDKRGFLHMVKSLGIYGRVVIKGTPKTAVGETIPMGSIRIGSKMFEKKVIPDAADSKSFKSLNTNLVKHYEQQLVRRIYCTQFNF